MQTQRTPGRLHFHPLGRREVVARFDGGRITSDAGGALLRETDVRLELGGAGAEADRYKRIAADPEAMDRLLVDVFVESHAEPPGEIWLDLDATDDPLHGRQEGRFFHGYYGRYCYLPLYIFCGPHLLCARLRRSNLDASAGSEEELERIVGQVRERWPRTRVVVRGDSGFCREPLIRWCEEHGVDYVFGMARNPRLVRALRHDLYRAEAAYRRSGKPARRYRDLRYRTRKSWSSTRRVVGKAEYLPKGANPRFVVTSLGRRRARARRLYEDLYCARGDMENRIKEQQLDLFADRTSSATLRANQLRLHFASFAYVLMHGLRRLGLAGTRYARAQCATIRLKLLKLGARVRVTSRKVWLSMSEAYPHGAAFEEALNNLRTRVGRRPGNQPQNAVQTLRVIASCLQRRRPPEKRRPRLQIRPKRGIGEISGLARIKAVVAVRTQCALDQLIGDVLEVALELIMEEVEFRQHHLIEERLAGARHDGRTPLPRITVGTHAVFAADRQEQPDRPHIRQRELKLDLRLAVLVRCT